MKSVSIAWIIAAVIAAIAIIISVIARNAGLAIFDSALLVFDLFMLRLTLR